MPRRAAPRTGPCSLRRALLMPQVNPESLRRCGTRALAIGPEGNRPPTAWSHARAVLSSLGVALLGRLSPKTAGVALTPAAGRRTGLQGHPAGAPGRSSCVSRSRVMRLQVVLRGAERQGAVHARQLGKLVSFCARLAVCGVWFAESWHGRLTRVRAHPVLGAVCPAV